MNLLARRSNRTTDPKTNPQRDKLQTHFLERLTRLKEIRNEAARSLGNQQRRLLNHALYSTYWDCAELGMKDDAQRLLGMKETAHS
jgi:hypothetical protein